MSLRTKILLSICAINVVVLLLLTLNLWLDAASSTKRESDRNSEFISRLVSEWIEKDPGLKIDAASLNWGAVAKKITESSLFSGYVIAGKNEGDLRIYQSSEVDPDRVLRREGRALSDVLERRETMARGNRVYIRLDTGRIKRVFAARFDIVPAAAPPASFLTDSIQRLFWIMGLGTALMLIVTYVLTNRFVLRPLEAMVGASGRVARGDFSTPIPKTTGYDEMARMIMAFNLMMDKIAETHRTMREDIRKAKTKIVQTEKRLFSAQRLSTTGTLAAGIAHEINNPLGGMINAARAIRKRDVEGEKEKEYLELIEDGLLRIRDTVAKVLTFTPKQLEPAPVQLRDVVEKAMAFLDHKSRKKNVTCRNEVPHDIPRVRGDALELQQAVLNILINAVDAVSEGEGEIRVRSGTEGKEVRLEVVDNGMGMTEEQIERCLDPFFTTKEVGQGTGLGLSISHNIVTNHGGRLQISAEKEKGTTVSMIFPVMPEEKIDTERSVREAK